MPAEDILSSKRIIHDSPAECKRKFLQDRGAQVVILNAKEHEAPKAGRDSSSAIIFCEGIDVYTFVVNIEDMLPRKDGIQMSGVPVCAIPFRIGAASAIF